MWIPSWHWFSLRTDRRTTAPPHHGAAGNRLPFGAMRGLRRPEPVDTIQLYPEERALLIGLLGGLAEADWERPTVCPGWSVRDVALHLLGDDLGLLSRQRDGYGPFGPVDGESLGTFLNRFNEEWVRPTRRLSARVLIELLDWSDEETYAYLRDLDPLAPGVRVSWAGPGAAPNWLGIAREYTERWVHQQQIRLVVGAPPLDGKDGAGRSWRRSR